LHRRRVGVSFAGMYRVLLAGVLLTIFPAIAQEKQNPSPMVEHTRAHERLEETKLQGQRLETEWGTLFIPQVFLDENDGESALPLLIFFHGGDWLPEVAAVKAKICVLRVTIKPGGPSCPESLTKEGGLRAAVAALEKAAGRKIKGITLGGWSLGCSSVRQILADPDARKFVDRVLCIDGIHASYKNGKPGPKESEIVTDKLAPLVEFAQAAQRGEKRMLVVHGEIFPGTFASTTETADWLLKTLTIPRQAVLAWGPRGTQQLSEARDGQFLLCGYAGNSAPDHVDLLHSLPEYLAWLEKFPDKAEKREDENFDQKSRGAIEGRTER
jgi:hypothetical protein